MGTSTIAIVSTSVMASAHGRVAATTTMGTSTIAIVSTSVMASASTSISISSGAIKCLSRERAIARTLDESNLLHDHLLGPVDTFRGASDYKVLLRSIWWSRLVDLRVCSACCVDTLDRLATLADDEANLGGGNQHVLGLVPLP